MRDQSCVKKRERAQERIQLGARGAALGTQTKVEVELLSGFRNYLPNDALAEITHRHLLSIGGVQYSSEEREFARELAKSFPQPSAADPAVAAAKVDDFKASSTSIWPGSSDVGDVSWVVPTNALRTAAWVPGTTAHTWQAAAASNMSIGLKGMHVGAKVVALTAAELLSSPHLLERARAELEQRRGTGFQYEPLVGDRNPPLDYFEPQVSGK